MITNDQEFIDSWLATICLKTTEQKQHICAELARRIWPEAEIRPEYEGSGILYMINPTATAIGTGWQCFNPIIDPAASRALVEWMAKQSRGQHYVFIDHIRNSTDSELPYEFRLMTAPLETIALAAARALSIIPGASNAPECHDDHAPGCPCAWCRVARDNAAMGEKNEAAPNTA